MKRHMLVILAMATFALAQTSLYTLKEPVAGMPLHGEMKITGKPLKTVIAAINAALARLSWQVQTQSAGRPPMPAYSYAAVKYPTPDPNKRQGLFIDIEVSGINSTIIADWYRVVEEPQRPKAQAIEFYDYFFELVVEGLK